MMQKELERNEEPKRGGKEVPAPQTGNSFGLASECVLASWGGPFISTWLSDSAASIPVWQDSSGYFGVSN